VPLPYQVYERMPFLEDRRGISRLIAYGHLALALLAALGLRQLIAWVPANHQRFSPFVALVALFLVGLEYWTPPNIVNHQPEPSAIAALGDEQGDFTIVHAPIGRSSWTVGGTQLGAYLGDYYGRIHEKRTIGGYVSRAPDASIFWIMLPPGIRYMSCPTCAGLPVAEDLDSDVVQASLQELGVKYVILHRTMPTGIPVGGDELASLAAYLSTTAGLVVEHQEPDFTIYRNPREGE
jgi:hypothetical protein